MAEIEFTECNEGEVKVNKIKDRNIVIVGLTGSGKSSIIKSLCSLNDKNCAVKMSFKSVTTNLTMYENNLVTNPNDSSDQYSTNLFDTVGLGDTDVDVPDILRQIIEDIPKNLSKIHRIVFCFKMDRLRAQMSEALNLVYHFFKLVGAQPENFVVCLTFCDILQDSTIKNYWDELTKNDVLELMKEIKKVTYTSFPNFAESDKDENLVAYLKKKTNASKIRIFQNVIQADCEPFYPYETITKMQQLNFDKMCEMLLNYRPKSKFWKFLSGKNEQQEILRNLQKLRTPLTVVEEKKKKKLDETIKKNEVLDQNDE